VFQNWNGGVLALQTPASATTYTANYITQYYLTTGAGTGGAISPASEWANAGTSVLVTATAGAGYGFTGFTGNLTGITDPQNITMNAPHTVTANFGLITVTAVPALTVQYSDSVTLTATVSAMNSALNSAVSGSLQFSVNGANAGGPVTVNGAGVYTVPYTITQAQGPYNVNAVFSGATAGILGSYANNGLTVSAENANVTPSANNPMAVQVSSTGGTASFQLTAAIQEVADGSLGDISKATPVTVKLNPLVAAPQVSCPVTTTVASGILTAVATCSSVPVNVYDVAIAIGGNYYTGSVDSVVSVFDPSLGAVTGGGVLSHNGVNGIFGVNVKYNKSGQAQGSVMYLEHRPGADVTLKSNSLQSMSKVGNTAVILGKATLGSAGNYTFQATAIGNGASRSNDLFGLQVTDPTGKLVPDLSFSPINLTGGNIQLPK
jgi:hypothetical protein